jgi:hypothetical protein
MNAFHVIGGSLAVWALLVSFLGVTRENFPGSKERLVAAISILLVMGAIGSAIVVGAREKRTEPKGGGHASLAPPV